MKISDHCYALCGFYCYTPYAVNAGLISGRDGQLIVDTGGSYLAAATVLGYAQALGGQCARQVINLEGHVDHMAGNSVFINSGIPVYGHSSINRSQTELDAMTGWIDRAFLEPDRARNHEGALAYTGTFLQNPTRPLDGPQVFDLGNIKARVLMTPGHSPANICVHAEEDGVLFSGDTLLNGYLPNCDEPSVETFQAWLNSLDLIETIKPALVIPGHGKVLSGFEAIKREIERFRLWINIKLDQI